jgi:hypothetical protein
MVVQVLWDAAENVYFSTCQLYSKAMQTDESKKFDNLKFWNTHGEGKHFEFLGDATKN